MVGFLLYRRNSRQAQNYTNERVIIWLFFRYCANGQFEYNSRCQGEQTEQTEQKERGNNMYNYYCSKEENAEYRNGERIDMTRKLDGLPILREWEITPNGCGRNQKNFYGKAHCFMTEKGWYLLSYDTIVCSLHANNDTGEINVLRRYWMNYSATTAKHINSFLYNFRLRALDKKEWESLKYNTPYIIDNVS